MIMRSSVKGEWHQIINPYLEACHIVEIQYGDETLESDIERLYLFTKNRFIYFISLRNFGNL